MYKYVHTYMYIPYTANVSRGKTFVVVHKTPYSLETFVEHQAEAIMYCTQQMIQGENFRKAKNHENHKSFPPQNIYVYRTKEMIKYLTYVPNQLFTPRIWECLLCRNNFRKNRY